MNVPENDVTRALRSIQNGESTTDRLIELVYDQLRTIARARMREERAGHTLQATALVNEACLKLLGDDGRSFDDRRQFFGAAAQAMRRILIDHARQRGTAKRGGGQSRLPLDVLDLAIDSDPAMVLALDEALDRLASLDETAAEVVRLRFYSGLSVPEVAQVMELSERSVAREWVYARAQLVRLLDDPESDEAS